MQQCTSYAYQLTNDIIGIVSGAGVGRPETREDNHYVVDI